MEAENQKEKALYEDQLARDRIKYRLEIEKWSKQKALKESEELVRCQKEYKKHTILYKYELKLKAEKEKLIKQYYLQAANE